jgi:hypothetical protein
MLSMVGIGGEFSIFSISMLGACFASSIPALGVVLVSLIGNVIKYGVGGTLGYFLTALILLVTLFVIKPIYNEEERNEKIKVGKNVFISILLIQIIKLAISGFTLYDILSGITLAIIGMVFYKIFVNSIAVLQDVFEKRAYTIEELIGASLLIAISVGAFGDLDILGFGVKNVLSIFIVMVLGWKNGILVGTTSGVTIRCYIRSNNWFRANYDCSLCNFRNDCGIVKQIWKNWCNIWICFRKCSFSICFKWVYSRAYTF